MARNREQKIYIYIYIAIEPIVSFSELAELLLRVVDKLMSHSICFHVLISLLDIVGKC